MLPDQRQADTGDVGCDGAGMMMAGVTERGLSVAGGLPANRFENRSSLTGLMPGNDRLHCANRPVRGRHWW